MAYITGTGERIAHDLIESKGILGYDEAHVLAFGLANVTAEVELAEESVKAALNKREEIILSALEAGLSYREVAKFVGLSHQRIEQIKRAADATV